MARSRKKAAEPAATEQATTPATDDTATEQDTVIEEPKPASPPEPVRQAPDIFDEQIALRQQEKAAEIVQGVADSTRIESERPANGVYREQHPGNGFASQHAPRTHALGFIANQSSTRRESHADAVSRKLPDKMTVTAGDLKVQLIDAGRNEMGIGIRVVFPEGRKPTDEEKEIIRLHIRGEEGEQTGFKWDRDAGLWLKHILREGEHVDDVPPSRPVAIRLDAERRVQQLAEA